MDRLEAMGLLLRVVDSGSFSAASRALRMPLATLSRKVSDLETHLGTRLLLRTTRRISLTDAGVAYIASARRILDDVEEMERVAAGEYLAPRGELALTAPLFFGRRHVLPLVADFLAAYPDINVRLLLSDKNLHLLDEHVDLAVRIGALPDSGMVASYLGPMRTVVCASPDLLAQHGMPRIPADLVSMPSVSFDGSAGIWSFRRGDGNGTMEIPLKPRLSVSTADAAVNAAVAGVGITRVLHYQCADLVRDGALRIVLEEFEVEPLPVHLVHAGRGVLPSKMRVFLDFAAGRLRKRLASL